MGNINNHHKLAKAHLRFWHKAHLRFWHKAHHRLWHKAHHHNIITDIITSYIIAIQYHPSINKNPTPNNSNINITDSMRHDYVMHVVPIALSVIRDTWHKADLRSA